MKAKGSSRVIAIVMAFLMLSSSMTFSMEMHFCGNVLKNFSLFGEVEECEMAIPPNARANAHSCCEVPRIKKNNCEKHEINNGTCCHNTTVAVVNNSTIEPAALSFELSQQILFLASFIGADFIFFEWIEEKIDYTFYHPPSLIKDFSVFLQVFRI